MRKKLISLVMALTMVLSLVPVNVIATDLRRVPGNFSISHEAEVGAGCENFQVDLYFQLTESMNVTTYGEAEVFIKDASGNVMVSTSTNYGWDENGTHHYYDDKDTSTTPATYHKAVELNLSNLPVGDYTVSAVLKYTNGEASSTSVACTNDTTLTILSPHVDFEGVHDDSVLTSVTYNETTKHIEYAMNFADYAALNLNGKLNYWLYDLTKGFGKVVASGGVNAGFIGNSKTLENDFDKPLSDGLYLFKTEVSLASGTDAKFGEVLYYATVTSCKLLVVGDLEGFDLSDYASDTDLASWSDVVRKNVASGTGLAPSVKLAENKTSSSYDSKSNSRSYEMTLTGYSIGDSTVDYQDQAVYSVKCVATDTDVDHKLLAYRNVRYNLASLSDIHMYLTAPGEEPQEIFHGESADKITWRMVDIDDVSDITGPVTVIVDIPAGANVTSYDVKMEVVAQPSYTKWHWAMNSSGSIVEDGSENSEVVLAPLASFTDAGCECADVENLSACAASNTDVAHKYVATATNVLFVNPNRVDVDNDTTYSTYGEPKPYNGSLNLGKDAPNKKISFSGTAHNMGQPDTESVAGVLNETGENWSWYPAAKNVNFRAEYDKYKGLLTNEMSNWNVLVLDHFWMEFDRTSNGPVILPDKTLVVLVGASKIAPAQGANGCTAPAVYGEGDLMIAGDGTLTVENVYGNAIYAAKTLTIDGGTVNAVATDTDFAAVGAKNVIVNDGTVNVTAYGLNQRKAAFSDKVIGLGAIETLTINGGTVNALATKTYNVDTNEFYGIFAENVVFNGGTVTATGDTAGVFAVKDVLTKQADVKGDYASVTSIGGQYGVNAGNVVNASFTNLTAKASMDVSSNSYGVKAQKGVDLYVANNAKVEGRFGVHTTANEISLNGGTYDITAKYTGVQAGSGNNKGSAVINAVSTLSVGTSKNGICANKGDITVTENGSVTVTSECTNGIYAKNGNITIKGNVTVGSATNVAILADAGDVSVSDNAVVNVNGGDYGIKAKNVDIVNATVTATQGGMTLEKLKTPVDYEQNKWNMEGCGIYATAVDGVVTVDSATVTSLGDGAGIVAAATVTATGTNVVKAYGHQYGIYAINVKVYDGDVTAEAFFARQQNVNGAHIVDPAEAAGIYASNNTSYGNVTVYAGTVKANAYLVASETNYNIYAQEYGAKAYGIYSFSNVYLYGGDVKATADGDFIGTTTNISRYPFVSYGIYAGNAVESNDKEANSVTATATNFGIYAKRSVSLTVKGKLTAQATGADHAIAGVYASNTDVYLVTGGLDVLAGRYGIYANQKVCVNDTGTGSTVEATKGYGIKASNTNVEIYKPVGLTVKAGRNGIVAKNGWVNVTNDVDANTSLTVNAGKNGIVASSTSLDATTLKITATERCGVKALCGEVGVVANDVNITAGIHSICSAGNVTVWVGTLTASSTDVGIFSKNGEVAVTVDGDSTVTAGDAAILASASNVTVDGPLTITAGDECDGIYAKGTVTQTGTLTVKGSDLQAGIFACDEVKVDNVTVDSAKTEVGIWTGDDLTVNGKVEVKGQSGEGLYVDNDLDMKSTGSVTVANAESRAIEVKKGDATLTDVTVKSGADCAIEVDGSVLVEAGKTVTVDGTNAFGVKAGSDVVVNGTVDASNTNLAIKADDTVTVSSTGKVLGNVFGYNQAEVEGSGAVEGDVESFVKADVFGEVTGNVKAGEVKVGNSENKASVGGSVTATATNVTVENSTVVGDVTAAKKADITGTVGGDVTADTANISGTVGTAEDPATVTATTTNVSGTVNGNVTATTTNVSGTVNGSVDAVTLKITGTGKVKGGDVEVTDLVVENNGTKDNVTTNRVELVADTLAVANNTKLKGNLLLNAKNATFAKGVTDTNGNDKMWYYFFDANEVNTYLSVTNKVDASTKALVGTKGGYFTIATNYDTIGGGNSSTSSGGGLGGGSVVTTVTTSMPLLKMGSKEADAIKTLQTKLNSLGYNCGAVDGIFGSQTYNAVVAFQKANGLTVDGVVGSQTWGKLGVAGVSYVTTAPSAATSSVTATISSNMPLVKLGSRGDAVKALQTKLNALGYDCGTVDGIFGQKTLAAVKAYQTARGLGVDGIVGNQTWGALL